MSKASRRRKKRKARAAAAGEVRSTAHETSLPMGTEDALAAAISVDPDLPAEHPLRRQAAVLRAAFCAVTIGPVTPDEVRLYEVPRSSPLAPWKTLIRAIAYFHRNEDDHCWRSLATIPADSAPALLVPVLMSLLDGEEYWLPREAGILLKNKITGAGNSILTKKARMVEGALRANDLPLWKTWATELMTTAKHKRPDLLDALQARILQAGISVQTPVEAMADSLAKPLRYDAAFWKTCARLAGEHLPPIFGLAYWDIVLGENWTERPVRLPLKERAAIAIHIIQSAFHAARQSDYYFNTNMKMLRDFYLKTSVARALGLAPLKGDALSQYLHRLSIPSQQFIRFIKEDPNEHLTDTLVHWLNPAGLPCDHKTADLLIDLWARERPLDPAPQMHLCRLAEARGAFTKALRHLDAARRLGADNEDLDRFRCQLLVSRTLKRLKDRKAVLAMEDIEELERNPLAADELLGVVLTVLRWAQKAKISGQASADTEIEALAEHIGVETVRALLIDVAHAAGLREGGAKLPKEPGKTSGDDILDALLWGHRIRRFLFLRYRFPKSWNFTNLASAVTRRGQALSRKDLWFLTHLAININNRDLRFAVSEIGLASGRNTARHLFLRALTMDPWKQRKRCRACWYYAAALSAQGSNPALRNEMLVHIRRDRWRSPADADEILHATTLAFIQEDVDELVAQELNCKVVPTSMKDERDEGPYRHLPVECDCAECRRMRELDAEGYDDDDEDDDEFNEDWDDEFNEDWDDDEDEYPYEDDTPEEPRWVENQERRDRARSERKRQSRHKKKQKKLQKKKKKK